MGYRALSIDLEEHRDKLVSLWKENMSDQHIRDVAERRFPWYYSHNPGGQPTTSLLLDDASNQIVGGGSFFPRKILFAGRSLFMGILSDFVVSSAHRAAGPAITIQRSLAEMSRAAGMSFLATYPNRAAEPIFKRVGYKPVGKAKRWVKPLHSHRQIRKRLSHPLLASPAAGIVDFGLAALDLTRMAGLHAPARHLRGVYLDSCDARFDRLWERAKQTYTITGERTSEYLKWRYRDFPSVKYRFFGLTDASGDRLLAYLTFFVGANNSAVIGDLFNEGSTHTLYALLLRFCAAERKAGRTAVCVDYVGPDTFGERLKHMGFHRRHSDRCLFVYFDPATPQDVQQLLLNESNWFALDAEMDI